jgi:hypothetical protein
MKFQPYRVEMFLNRAVFNFLIRIISSHVERSLFHIYIYIYIYIYKLSFKKAPKMCYTLRNVSFMKKDNLWCTKCYGCRFARKCAKM